MNYIHKYHHIDKPYQYKDVSDILKDVGNSAEIIEKIYKKLS